VRHLWSEPILGELVECEVTFLCHVTSFGARPSACVVLFAGWLIRTGNCSYPPSFGKENPRARGLRKSEGGVTSMLHSKVLWIVT